IHRDEACFRKEGNAFEKGHSRCILLTKKILSRVTCGKTSSNYGSVRIGGREERKREAKGQIEVTIAKMLLKYELLKPSARLIKFTTLICLETLHEAMHSARKVI
ncbi:unnamed protein product, partial [Heterotrigona itama]